MVVSDQPPDDIFSYLILSYLITCDTGMQISMIDCVSFVSFASAYASVHRMLIYGVRCMYDAII